LPASASRTGTVLAAASQALDDCEVGDVSLLGVANARGKGGIPVIEVGAQSEPVGPPFLR
jgi:hypothetical protein